MPRPEQVDHVVALLEEVCARHGIDDVYFVGGLPRAIAMGLGLSDVKDLDIASGMPGKAVQLAGLVAEEGDADYYKLLHRTGTITMEVNGVEMDFQGPMQHEDVRPFLHLWGVDDTPMARNIFGRDFTINSLAIPIGGYELVDMTRRAMDDIEDSKIASILPPDYAVPKNPLMITRAVKFAYKYDYKIDGPLWAAMKDSVGQLEKSLSPERLAIEAFVLAKYDCGDMLDELGLHDMHSPEMIEAGEEAVSQ